MNLSWHNTDQVWVLSRLTFFYRSYCPLLKFSFPDFSLPSFDMLTWNLVYEFVMTYFYRSYCPLLKLKFSGLFSAVAWDIDLKFGIWICHDTMQLMLEFRHTWPTLKGVITLCSNFVFRTFLCSLLRYSIKILYMNCFWLNSDQVQVSSCLTFLYRSLFPYKNLVFPDFSLSYFDLLTCNYFWALLICCCWSYTSWKFVGAGRGLVLL